MNDRSRRSPRTAIPKICTHPAFSLVELLAVVAIISIMLAFIAPAIGNFGSTAGRKGAVNILMNTMEQARVAALESGRNVYIVFIQREFPDRDAIVVLRDPEPDAPAGTAYEQLTRFIQIPKGVLLYSGKAKSILNQSLPVGFNSAQIPGVVPSGTISVLQFNGHGGIEFPTKKFELMLIVSEGVRGLPDETAAVIAGKKEQFGGFEIISLRRFTGRASLEVSSLPGA